VATAQEVARLALAFSYFALSLPSLGLVEVAVEIAVEAVHSEGVHSCSHSTSFTNTLDGEEFDK
jgi:hypothetical protein